MNDTENPQPIEPTENDPIDETPSKPIDPRIAGIVLVLLMMFFFGLSQYTEYFAGPQLTWGQDLEAAKVSAQNSGRRIFLYLCEPGCVYASQYDRELLTTRGARERLAQMIPVRIEIGEDDPLRVKYGFRQSPMMVVVGADGEPISNPLVGSGIDERQFKTNIHPDDER